MLTRTAHATVNVTAKVAVRITNDDKITRFMAHYYRCVTSYCHAPRDLKQTECTMKKRLLVSVIAASCLALAGCEVEQTEEGSMPSVDVDAEEGNMPEYEVRQVEEGEMPSVDVDAEGGNMPEYDVDAPDVDVSTGEKEITVPTLDVDVEPAGEADMDDPVERMEARAEEMEDEAETELEEERAEALEDRADDIEDEMDDPGR